MSTPSSNIAFSPAVKAIQTSKGSRSSYARMESHGGWQTKITSDLASFLEQLDMFYLGTANAEGQPYIQYRGGPSGFLNAIDEQTLGFADFGGNRQYITLGNLSENPKAFIFLMDYVNRQRIKLWGRAEVIEGDEELNSRLRDPQYAGKVERAVLFHVEAWDANCPQHIHRRLPADVVESTITALKKKISDLQSEVARLRSENMEASDAVRQHLL